MARLLVMITSALVLGMAAALELPGEGDVAIVADGQVVGQGSFEDGNLELELLAGFSGFATLTVVDGSGNEWTVDVMVDQDSSIVITESLEDLVEAVEENGGEATVRVEEELEARGNMAFGAALPDHVDLPVTAEAGMEAAAENYAEAEARAEDAREGDGAGVEGRARGEVSAGARSEEGNAEAGAEAEASVKIGIGAGRSR